MGFGVGAIVGSSVVSGLLGRSAAKKAVGAQLGAARVSTDEIRRQFDLVWETLAPYRELGQEGIGELRALLGLSPLETTTTTTTATPEGGGGALSRVISKVSPQFGMAGTTETTTTRSTAATDTAMERLRSRPGFQFRLAEGTKAVEAGQAARSGVLSGRAQKELLRFGQEFGSREFDKEVARLTNVINIGRGAATTSAAAAQTTGSQVAQISLGAGAAQATGFEQSAQAINNAIQGGVGNLLYYDTLRNLAPQAAA